MAGNNIIVIIGLLIVIANFFQPHLQLNRELKMLRAGFLIFALLALHANIAPWLKKGYASFYLEWVGFSIFFSCLGYAVARRFFQNEKELITIAHELETARQIQSFILPKESVNSAAGHPPLFVWRGGEQKIYEFREKSIILGQFADVLIQHLFNWSDKRSEEALDDDLTLIVVDYQHV